MNVYLIIKVVNDSSIHSLQQTDNTIVEAVNDKSCEIVVGIFTFPSTPKELRDVHRSVIDSFDKTTRDASQCSSAKPILVQFVAVIPMDGYSYQTENDINNDLIFLQIGENMNDGKSYNYFASVMTTYRHLNAKIILKADIDNFLHYENLYQDLQNFTKSDELIYYGKDAGGFMTGMLYGFSRLLLQKILRLEWVVTRLVQYSEDRLSATWVSAINSNEPVVYVNREEEFYDHPDTYKPWSKPFIKKTIAIHQLKRWDLWNSTIYYFFEGEKRNNIVQKLNKMDQWITIL